MVFLHWCVLLLFGFLIGLTTSLMWWNLVRMKIVQKVKVVLTDRAAEGMMYASEGSAGLDVVSCENVTIVPGKSVIISSGIRMKIPRGFYAHLVSRSGLSVKKGVFVINSPGIIDNDYHEEIRVCLYNANNEAFDVRRGDRIAQLLLMPLYKMSFKKVDAKRLGEGRGFGFGSSGGFSE
ncbi:MAG: dUTP diphosphatase [Thermoproteota archaeon]|nr:MAG: dUTP diphosphatase [Candidatus Korarchaeota archaeon]